MLCGTLIEPQPKDLWDALCKCLGAEERVLRVLYNAGAFHLMTCCALGARFAALVLSFLASDSCQAVETPS